MATWAGYKKAGPLLISTDRRGTADGKPLQISFSDVAVKLAGSDRRTAGQFEDEQPAGKPRKRNARRRFPAGGRLFQAISGFG
jgi:hypothetical protein